MIVVVSYRGLHDRIVARLNMLTHFKYCRKFNKQIIKYSSKTSEPRDPSTDGRFIADHYM